MGVQSARLNFLRNVYDMQLCGSVLSETTISNVINSTLILQIFCPIPAICYDASFLRAFVSI